MKVELRQLLIVILIWFIAGVASTIAVVSWTKVLRPEPPKIDPVQLLPSDFEIKRYCQYLAATTTRDNWKYADCVNELSGALKTKMPTVEA